jgi:MFS family permease
MGRVAFRWFLLGYGLDRWADMLWITTLAWLASSASSSAVAGAILGAAFLPHVAALLLGGATADRRGPAAIARATTVAKMLLLGGLLVVQGAGSSSLLLVASVAALLAVVDGFHDPAMDSWGMHLLPPEEQQQAAAAEATVWRVGQSLGAALGGLLVGVGAVYALGAGVVLLALARLTFVLVGRRAVMPVTDVDADTGARQRIRAGLTFLRRHPVLPTTMAVQVTCTLTSGAALVLLLPALARSQDWPGAVYGIAATCFGLGLIVGSSVVLRGLAAGASRRITRPVRLGLTCAFVASAPLALLAQARHPAELVVEVFAYGLMLGPVGPLLSGYRRSQTPTAMSGVVAAATKLLLIAPEPLGPLLVGLLAAATSLSTAAYVCAAVGAFVAAVGLLRSGALERQCRQVSPGQ